MKMADVDIDHLENMIKQMHSLTPDTGKTIPFKSGGVIEEGSTWEPECTTPFRGKTQSTRLKEVWVEGLYQKLSEKNRPNPRSISFR